MAKKKQTINIPGIILDELKERDYTNDSRFNGSRLNGKKRSSGSNISRKDRRKQQRLDKKHKGKTVQHQPHNSLVQRRKESKSELQDARTSNEKSDRKHVSKSSTKKDFELPFSSDDELSSGDFDDFDEGDLNEEELEQLRELEEEDDDEDEDENEDDLLSESEFDGFSSGEEMSFESTMSKLQQLKGDKLTASETNERKPMKHRKKKIEIEEEMEFPMLPAERAALEKDEMEMQYYAKKLNLKGSKKKIRAKDEFDAIGGLLEGLDYFENYGENDEEYGDFAINDKSQSKAGTSSNDDSESEASSDNSQESEVQSQDDEEEAVDNPFSSDDELSSDDFDDFDEGDLNEEEWKQLRELEDDSEDEENIIEDEVDETASKKSKKSKKEKENPYAAPGVGTLGEYVPPSMRKQQLETSQDSAEVIELKKKVKSALNKLSDSNITVIISSLNELYNKYPRQYVTTAITNQILEIISQNNKLLDSFIMNYSAVAFSLWELRGIEVGATFVQSVVERFLEHYEMEISRIEEKNDNTKDNSNSDNGDDQSSKRLSNKTCNNIITLIAYSYNFGLITCKLIYNFIQKFVNNPSEFTTELLLRIVAVSGLLLRGDDPSALKDIITELLTNVKAIAKPGPRLKFLLDTMSDLKNNRLKPSILATSNQHLKKNLSSFLKRSHSSEPLQVSLDDIENVNTKGKWWLVGASWRGNMENAFEEAKGSKTSVGSFSTNISIEDSLLEELPDWTEISKQQRMNTDVRRAIFVSIMSAQDYLEAFTKIEKLNLKNKQILEIPKVIYHCLLTDSVNNGYNPYYALVAAKISEHHHSLLKSFQFLFWDNVKKFEEDDEGDFSDVELDENKQLKKTIAQGKFFGTLLSENVLQLDVFKHVPIMGGLTSDGLLFVEVTLFQLLLSIAKKSEQRKKSKTGSKSYDYNSEYIRKLLMNIKIENKGTILKSLKWFVIKKLKYENYLPNKKDEKAFKRDSRRIAWAVDNFVSLVSDELSNYDE